MLLVAASRLEELETRFAEEALGDSQNAQELADANTLLAALSEEGRALTQELDESQKHRKDLVDLVSCLNIEEIPLEHKETYRRARAAYCASAAAQERRKRQASA